MDILSKIELTKLFDAYGKLLTEKQQVVLNYYLIDDLGISEISEILNKTRQATYDFINVSVSSLKKMEEKIKYVETTNKLKEGLLNLSNNKDLNRSQICEKLKEISENL
ncbi:MAG: hypothetical protein IJT25_00260 [Clostridia bacterium]|nr:hypothetical protein [Clostridia bacterium]